MKRLIVLAVASAGLLASSLGETPRLRVGDTFQLQLAGMPPEFSQQYALQLTIGESGKVILPQIREVQAAGLTADELARRIEQKLVEQKIFVEPVAVVTVDSRNRLVTIGGAVRAPQTFSWSSEMTLSSAVSQAGGFNDFGRQDKVRLTRNGKAQMFDLRRADRDAAQNPKLLPGDEVAVLE